MDCFALFFHPSVVKVASLPRSFDFNLSSTFAASQSRIGQDNVRRSGTTASGTHLRKNRRICGLFAAFHGARIAINSLHRSSPNSVCVAEVHNDLLESSKTLEVRLRFDSDSEVIDAGSSSGLGLGSGDGVAEKDGPDVGACKEWDQLAEYERRRAGWSSAGSSVAIASALADWARVLVAGSTCTHLLRCGTMFCFGLPAIGGQLMRAERIHGKPLNL